MALILKSTVIVESLPTDKLVRSNNFGLFSRAICHHSSSRDDLATLIEEYLKGQIFKSPRATHLTLRDSVEEVRTIAGENNHIFIRGKYF